MLFAYGVSAYCSTPRPLSFELSQWAVWFGRKRLPGNTLPGIRATECNFPGNALPGWRFGGILTILRCTRDDIVDPVDIVIRITATKKKTNNIYWNSIWKENNGWPIINRWLGIRWKKHEKRALEISRRTFVESLCSFLRT